jgi:hypothetical protein
MLSLDTVIDCSQPLATDKRSACDITIEIPRNPLTFDFSSNRSTDIDGRLHVTDCVLSAATVDPYLGKEIVDFQNFNLDPDRIYHVWRMPDALERAAPTLENLQLMADHIGVNVNEPQQQTVVGVVSNVRWRASQQQLIGDIAVWEAGAIAAIRDGSKKDLSCGYRYTPINIAGKTPAGIAYDLRMTDIIFNHCATVATGRVPGATVNDQLPQFRRTNVLDQIQAERDRVQRERENSPLARLIPGYYRL